MLPHPEEPPNFNQTVQNVNVEQFLDLWLQNWQVPQTYWDYWKTQIVITIDPTFSAPAGTYDGPDGKRHLVVRPEWLNPGVIAHEQAHNSYALLPHEDKCDFGYVLGTLKDHDQLVKYLFKINSYGLTNNIEAHAEIYRYIGEKMPNKIKRFYPKLLEAA